MCSTAVALTLLLAAAPTHPAGTDVYAWSHVVFLAGDFASTRGQLEHVTEPEAVVDQIPTLVLHDRPGLGDSVAYRARYCPAEERTNDACTAGGSEPIALSTIDPSWTDEVDLGKASTYARFLSYVSATYPSRGLLVTLKGRSRFGHVLRDDDAGGDTGLTITGLRQALAETQQSRGTRVEVLVLATSASASIEYAMALQGTVAVMVGTQQSVGDGRSEYFRPAMWSLALREYPGIGARELGRRVCTVYRDPSYPSFEEERPYAVSAVDLSSAATIEERLTDLFEQLHSLGDEGLLTLEAAGDGLWHYGADSTRTDLGALLERLSNLLPEGRTRQAALRAYVAVQNAVVDSSASGEPSPTGLSIFFPAQPTTQFALRRMYRERYGPFIHDSGWQALLKARLRYWRSQASGCALLSSASTPGARGTWVLLVAAALAAATLGRARPRRGRQRRNDDPRQGRG